MIKLTISGRIPSKKNSKRIVKGRNGRPLIIPSKKHKEWHTVAAAEVMSQTKEIDLTDVCVVMRVFAPDKRSGDLTNKAESIMDLLVDTGVIKDDNWFIIPGVILSFGGVDRENPRAEIEIYEPGESVKIDF